MNRLTQLLVVSLLILVFIFAFRKSQEIQDLKNRIPQNSPVKEDGYTVAEHIGENGSGTELKRKFPDLETTSFDPTGIGSGPIDYLYSKKADITFFYCKDFDSIISFEKGKIVYSASNKTSYNN